MSALLAGLTWPDPGPGVDWLWVIGRIALMLLLVHVLLILAALHAVTLSATVAPAGSDGGATAVCAARVTVHTSGVRICKPLLVAELASVCVASLADVNEQEFKICPLPERSPLTELQGTPLGSRPPPALFVAT